MSHGIVNPETRVRTVIEGTGSLSARPEMDDLLLARVVANTLSRSPGRIPLASPGGR